VRSRSVRSMRQEDQRGGRVIDKEACTVHTINITSQRQYFVASCLSSCVGNAFVYVVYAFVFLLPAS
jgi:hypothetical protein